jgi:hypothetical protein
MDYHWSPRIPQLFIRLDQKAISISLPFPESWVGIEIRIRKKIRFQKRDCPPRLGGQHDRRSCEGWLIKLTDGFRSTTPALRATPPNLGGHIRPITNRLFMHNVGFH